ncbi:MAG: hypothetical protein ACI81V_000496 [Lentimonas sp.]|jgi:hypothetical protein
MLNEQRQLSAQLARAGRKLQRLEGRLLWLRGIPALLGLLLCLMVLDFVIQLSPGALLAYLIGYLSLAAGIAISALWVGYIRTANPRRTARHLETRAPELGSALINFLDLQTTANDPSKPELTRMMAAHALDDHAAKASRLPLPQLARNPHLKSAFQILATVVCCLALVCYFLWPFFRTHLPRFFDPFGDHPPYSMTTLNFAEPQPDGPPVVFGESLRIIVDARGHQPHQVELIYWPTQRPDERYRTAMLNRGESSFIQQIQRVEDAMTFRAQTPDGRSRTKEIQVGIHLTPKINNVEIEIRPPAYTGLPTARKKYEFNELRALKGSEIILTAHSNRPLATGEIRMERPLESQPFQTVMMRTTDTNTVSAPFVMEQSTGFSIRVTDTDGLTSSPTPRGSIQAVEDRAPSLAITHPGTMTLLALDASVEVKVEAHDDYGLTELRIHRAINGLFTPPLIIPAAPKARNMTQTWTIDFSELGVQPEDRITAFAETIDNAPEPQIARSEIITITALSVEDYNSLLRQEVDMSRVAKKYAAIKESFDQLMETQAELMKKTQAISQEFANSSDPAARAALLQQLAKQHKEQTELNRALQALAEPLESAVRNTPLYDVESSWRKQLQQEADNVRSAAKTNQAQLASIMEQMASPELSPAQQAKIIKQFQQALQAQREQLLGSEKTIQDASQSMDEVADFHEMLKNFNRYGALTNQQRALATHTAAYNQNSRLSRADQIALRDLALEQKLTSEELDLLVNKLRKDAEAAAPHFPKAAASSLSFADAIEASRAQSLSSRATEAMLDGRGKNSAELAAATAEAMESLIGQCNGGMSQMSDELDRRLSASRPATGNSGNSFQQMLENMRMRYGASGSMSGLGAPGQGAMGMAGGYSTAGGDRPALLGNESLADEGTARSQNTSAGGAGGEGGGGIELVDSTGEAGALSQLQEQRRRSGSVRGESLFIEHDDIVDAYFNKITE